MLNLTELRDQAIAKGLNVVIPVYSKVASTVTELADTSVGKTVTGVAKTGIELASPVVEMIFGRENGRPLSESVAATPGAPASTRRVPSKGPASKTSPGTPTKPASGSGTKTATAKKGSKAPKKVTPSRPAEDIPTVKAVEAPVHTPSGAPVPGVVTPEKDDLPIAGYTSLSAAEIPDRLAGLTQTDLAALFAYEKAHDSRTDVLEVIEGRMVDLPLPTYDSLQMEAILLDIETLSAEELKVIRDYEAATKNRLPILEKIDSRFI